MYVEALLQYLVHNVLFGYHVLQCVHGATNLLLAKEQLLLR